MPTVLQGIPSLRKTWTSLVWIMSLICNQLNDNTSNHSQGSLRLTSTLGEPLAFPKWSFAMCGVKHTVALPCAVLWARTCKAHLSSDGSVHWTWWDNSTAGMNVFLPKPSTMSAVVQQTPPILVLAHLTPTSRSPPCQAWCSRTAQSQLQNEKLDYTRERFQVRASNARCTKLVKGTHLLGSQSTDWGAGKTVGSRCSRCSWASDIQRGWWLKHHNGKTTEPEGLHIQPHTGLWVQSCSHTKAWARLYILWRQVMSAVCCCRVRGRLAHPSLRGRVRQDSCCILHSCTADAYSLWDLGSRLGSLPCWGSAGLYKLIDPAG